MSTLPFTDAGELEICARVIYRQAESLYKSDKVNFDTLNKVRLHLLRNEPELRGHTWYHSTLLSLSIVPDRRGALAAWRDGIIERERSGYTWRRCLYSAYKGTRRDPRVTNRGVTPRRSSEQTSF